MDQIQTSQGSYPVMRFLLRDNGDEELTLTKGKYEFSKLTQLLLSSQTEAVAQNTKSGNPVSDILVPSRMTLTMDKDSKRLEVSHWLKKGTVLPTTLDIETDQVTADWLNDHYWKSGDRGNMQGFKDIATAGYSRSLDRPKDTEIMCFGEDVFTAKPGQKAVFRDASSGEASKSG